MNDNPPIPSLTGLRFLAAFSVALAHGASLALKFDQPPLGLTFWLTQGVAFGMTLFFVLSGFVIHYNYRTLVADRNAVGIATFIWARFARLYPLFILILLIDIILGNELFQFMLGNPVAFSANLQALPYYLTLTQSWFYVPIADRSLIYALGNNAPLTWSISTEWFFYLSYILLAFLLIRLRNPRSLTFAGIAWCVGWWMFQLKVRSHNADVDAWAVSTYGAIAGQAKHYQDSFVRWLTYFSPYSRIGEFILGAIVAQLYLQSRTRRIANFERQIGSVLLAAGIISIPVMIWGRAHYSVINVYAVPDFGPAPSVAIIIFCLARYSSPISRSLSSSSFVALGEASYSIYLIHFLVFYIAAGYNQMPLTGDVAEVAFLLARLSFLLILIILIALGLHAFYEFPVRRWLRGLWSSTHREGWIGGRTVALLLLAAPGGMAVASTLVSLLAHGSTSATKGLHIVAASYGANCGALAGNATNRLRAACEGRPRCEYRVDASIIGDPAPRCGKAFVAEYQCRPNGETTTKTIPGEAGLGSVLLLNCSELSAR